MTEFWFRKIEVTTAGLRLTFPETEIRFRVTFDETDDPTFAIIELFNLRRETENKIQVGEALILSAGYQQEIGTLIAGEITHVYTREDGVDRVCEVEVVDATHLFLSQTISRAYVENSRLSFIIRDILETTGLEIGQVSLPKTVIYPQGRVVEGRVKEVLQQLIADGDAKMNIVNGSVFVVPKNYGETVGAFLSADSGLIRSPARIDSEDAEWEVECLLNYRIREGAYIQIESQTASGTYRVVSGYHDSAGDRHVTKVEVVGV